MGDLRSEFEDVLKEELVQIRRQRKNRKTIRDEKSIPDSDSKGDEGEIRENLTGLALSGGGIRSAAFGMGVLQGLKDQGVLEEMDYLSTVSGGGYIGSSLTWFLHKLKIPHFPFGKKGEGARTGAKNAILDHIRQHGNYLDPGHGLNALSLVAVILRSMFLSMVVYFPILCAIILGLQEIRMFDKPEEVFEGLIARCDWIPFAGTNMFIWLAMALLGIFASISVLYSVGTFISKWMASRYKAYCLRVWFQKWMGRLLAVIIICLVLGALPFAVDAWTVSVKGQAGASVLLGYLGAIASYLMKQREGKAKGGGMSLTVIVGLACSLLTWGVLLLAYIVAKDYGLTVIYVAMFSLLAGVFVNLNYVTLHRMYRDRLSETFLPNPSTVEGGKDKDSRTLWTPATEANEALLASMCTENDSGPYHLIGTNIVLVDSKDTKYRARGGDCFMLSPMFCGSHATKWCETGEFMNGKMTLSTAMAISGAAVNPNTGASGKGPTRERLASALMAFLNLRLGFWAVNPTSQVKKCWLPKYIVPDYFVPGLKSLLGIGLKEDAYFIELTDGGHFENLGLYELVRRRVRIIIASDAGGQGELDFNDLSNAVEKIRVDFGVHIRFTCPDMDLSYMYPATEGRSAIEQHYNLAERGFAMAEIDYGDDEPGLLYYIKTVLTKGLPSDVYGYKSNNQSFPRQTTADQFFDEQQFEAYRELGYCTAKSMIEHDRVRNGELSKLLKRRRSPQADIK